MTESSDFEHVLVLLTLDELRLQRDDERQEVALNLLRVVGRYDAELGDWAGLVSMIVRRTVYRMRNKERRAGALRLSDVAEDRRNGGRAIAVCRCNPQVDSCRRCYMRDYMRKRRST